MNRRWREIKDNGFKSGPSNDSYCELLEDVIQPLHLFSLADVRAATNGFNEGCLIVRGGYGNVYKGFLDGETRVVAIKRFREAVDKNKILTEITLHSRLGSHPHIVSLIGYCSESPELCGVYDYMANGSLDSHLYRTNDKDPLLWKKRLDICIGAAQGLQHLYVGVEQGIIHRDIKPSNILLDENWVAKVNNFTMSKLIPNYDASEIILNTVACGSIGYIAPEYFMPGTLSKKADVYSFGAVLLEVLCAKKLYSRKSKGLIHCFNSGIKNGTIDQVIDPYLIGQIAPECLREFVKVLLRCLLHQEFRRPTMGDVVGSLQLALDFDEGWREESMSDSESDE